LDEPALDLSQVTLSRQREVVRVFYKEMWDHANTALVPNVFTRTSPSVDRWVHIWWGTSDILALAEEGNRVFGKLRFHGYHRRELFGIRPAGRHVWRYGTPIFTFEGDLVRDLWVLGDIYGLIARLKRESPGA
jgi:hypothetical protein